MTRRALWSQLRRRPATTAIVFLLGLLLAVGVIGPATVRLSAERAVGDSLRADLGGRTYALQTGDPDVAAVMATVRGASPVLDDVGAVSDGARRFRVSASLRLTDDPDLRLGVLTKGIRPSRPGEALLSEAAAEAVGLGIGDRGIVSASSGDLDLTITGLTVDPADTGTRTAVILLGPDARRGATRWLGDASLLDVAALQRPLEERRASIQSTGGLVEAAAQAQPQFVTALRSLPWSAGLAVAVLLAAFAGMRARRWSADVETLVAAGMGYGAAWRLVLDGTAAVLLTGLVAGAGLTLGTLGWFRVEVSSWFGQRWVTLGIPWIAPLALALAFGCVVLLLRWPPRSAWSRLRGLIRRPAASSRAARRWAPWTVLVVALAAWTALLADVESKTAERALVLLPMLAAVAVATLPFAVAPLLRIGLGPALRAISRAVANGLAVIVAAAAVIALLAGTWSAQQYRDARSGELASSPMQPAGSLVVDRMPDTALDTLRRVYRAAGGAEMVAWKLPDESSRGLRVTSPTLVTCLARSGADRPDSLPADCWPQDASSPINTVMLGAPGTAASADPRLLDRGRIGLLLFDNASSAVTRSETATAVANETLGGLVPGLVLAPDGVVARRYGLRASGMSEVALLDFAELDRRARLSVRAEVARLAPSAQLADGTDPTAYDRLRSTADLAAILGGAAAFVLLMLGLTATATVHTSARRMLVDLGGTSRLRFSLMARWLALPALVAALTAVMTLLTASYALRRPIGDLGFVWLLPSASLLVVTMLAMPAFLRVPVPASE